MSECACGCGERTAGGTFRPGHDQKLRADTEARAGGLLSLARLIDAVEDYMAERTSSEALAARIRDIWSTRVRT